MLDRIHWYANRRIITVLFRCFNCVSNAKTSFHKSSESLSTVWVSHGSSIRAIYARCVVSQLQQVLMPCIRFSFCFCHIINGITSMISKKASFLIGIVCVVVLLSTMFWLFGTRRPDALRQHDDDMPMVQMMSTPPGRDAITHPASCVDCERQFTADMQWQGQRSKCYSCESDMAQRCGSHMVFHATKQKLFDA